jgi:hypothetical protein
MAEDYRRPKVFSIINPLEVSINNPDPSELEHSFRKADGFTFTGPYSYPSTGGTATFQAWIRDPTTSLPIASNPVTFPGTNSWSAKFDPNFTNNTGHTAFFIRLVWAETSGIKHVAFDMAFVNIT